MAKPANKQSSVENALKQQSGRQVYPWVVEKVRGYKWLEERKKEERKEERRKGERKGGEDGAKVLRRLNSWRGGVALIRSQFSDSWIWSEVSLRTCKGPEVDLPLKNLFLFCVSSQIMHIF